MAHVKITVVNDSTVQENFSIFNSFPQESASSGQPWQNVWAVSPLVNSIGGSTTFNITEEYFAVCGISPKKIADGVVVSTQDQLKVILASASTPGTSVPMQAKDQGVYLDKDKIDVENKPGTFQIVTDRWEAGKYGL